MSTQYTVLIADDDPDIRAIISASIAALGVMVEEVADGELAISSLKSQLPDLVILDIMMPGLDGNQVCGELRKLPDGEFVPVLMLTARDTLKDKVQSLEGGADDYLTKPFHYEELQARVRALLRARELHLRLSQQNRKIQEMQSQLIDKERQLAVGQLAGTAAHQLGQPLSAILLNCHLLGKLPDGDQRRAQAVESIKTDVNRMARVIEELRSADASETESYHAESSILRLK